MKPPSARLGTAVPFEMNARSMGVDVGVNPVEVYVLPAVILPPAIKEVLIKIV
jgi:hypothetical protein